MMHAAVSPKVVARYNFSGRAAGFCGKNPSGVDGPVYGGVAGKRRLGRELCQCLVMRQEDPAAEMGQEIAAGKALHDRALDLGQVQRDPGISKPVHYQLETFQGAAVDPVHRGAVQDDMTNLKTLCDGALHHALDGAGISEEQAFVDAQAEDFGGADHVMAQDIAEMLGAGNLADLCDIGGVSFATDAA